MHAHALRVILAIAAFFSMTGVALAQPPASESGFVEVEDGVRIFYQRFGTGTPTVFIPNRLELTYAFASLLPFHDVLTWDPRGRGLSSRPDDLSRYGLEAELADAEALRRHFGAERVTYVGISLWANVAMLYAARHPDSVAGVVALGAFPVRSDLEEPPGDPIVHDLADAVAEMEAMRSDGRDRTEPYAFCVLDKSVAFADSYVDIESMAPLLAANVCQYRNEHPDMIVPVIFEGIFGSFGAWDWRDDMTRVRAPVLLIHGDRDWSLEGVRAHVEFLPDVEWVLVPDAGHHVWNDRADVVLPMMDAFFTRVRDGGPNR
jgi:pimeloyl-ACP methyl ester carboxylesterase